MAEIITGLVLLCWAWQDIKEKSVSVVTLIAGGVILIALSAAGGERGTFLSALSGALPGILLLTASFFPGRSVGAADGTALLFLGLVTGAAGIVRILICGLAAFMVCAVLLLLCRRINAESRLPFLPFVLVGYVSVWIGVTV